MKYYHIDTDVIHKAMLGNTEMVKQFLEMYISQCPLDFQDLAENIQKKDFRGIADAAHHIKPTMEYVGATELRTDLHELESLARHEKDITVIREKFEGVQAKFSKLMQEISALRDSL